MTVRKEIRDMTSEEMKRFHEAVQELKDSGPRNAWDEFRDLYMHHISEAKGGASFLPWNRLFLRRVEQKLQELDCGVVLPYFDFTTDVGNFAEAIIWQANYFGGNGKGACVPDNPFEGSQSWRPCLVRDFNLTVQLPTMVDMLLAISSNDYETMRSCLETYAAYVNLFVGGDMKSVASPYDPVYFAIYSYIDFLYWRWQNKPGNRPDNYPEFLKEVPMYPFHVRPEDVLNIESQLCYTYRLPSIGTPCNNTDAATIFGQDGFNELGFNRQGFDRNGFDVYGFNLQGYDRRGRPDSRNFYSADGYDQLGYDRSGYDRLGYNQYGYNKQGFNRDGFDNSGYDRNGFDRYGYDRDGYDNRGYNRQGYNRQGEQDQSEYYGPEGFCDACYDVSGLTRSGYDRYGYNLRGYNQQNCNYSYGGPHVTSLLYRVQDRLYQQNKNFLMTIERTCVELQPLPVTWYEQNWIQDRKDVTQMVPVRISQYPGSHWADRFCFKVDNFISACPCDTEYVICRRNPCAGLTCAAFPQADCRVDFCGTCTAVWFVGNRIVNCDGCSQNGEEHGEGSSWQPEPCQSCTCQMGRVLCAPIICPPPRCRNPVSVPGECCPSPACTDCEYKNKVYNDGTEFIDQVDVCQTCTCQRGNVECARMFCPQPQCSNPIPQPGKCCPVCPQGCEYEGRKLRNGQIFDADRCTSCTCLRGQVECRRRECPVLLCQEQYTPPGDCCPRCEGGCEYEMMTFDDGTYFTPMSNPCLNCSCLGGSVNCANLQVCRQTCPHGVRTPGTCCSPCTDCFYEGQSIRNGMTFVAQGDLCNQCRCSYGVVQCVREQCQPVNCVDVEVPPGSCCPVCRGCVDSYGQRHVSGAQFRSPEDRCQLCTCTEGSIVCRREACQVRCDNPVQRPGQCCASCDGCTYQGVEYRNGAPVDKQDPCTRCICQNGDIICNTVRCAATPCANPIVPPGECCPVCGECTYDGQTYPSGETFVAPRNPCLRCTCRRGELDCDRLDLECRPQCTSPGRLPDVCCPVCDICEYERRNYRNGARFRPPGADVCTECSCLNGNVRCSVIECQPVNCANPTTKPDECCPACQACFVNGREYAEGQTFRSPNDPCADCVCTGGRAQCEKRSCNNVVQCTHPVTEAGQCCPVCTDCLFDQRRFTNGQRFQNPSNPCQTCYCESGNVRCDTTYCQPPNCFNPVRKDGQCCPECPEEPCLFENQNYNHAQQFTHPTQPCTLCACNNGEVTCQAQPCPSVPCRQPAIERCCGTCEDMRQPCTYGGDTFEDGERFTNPGDTCQDCVCRRGQVTCNRMPCPSVTCPYPVRGECCQSCNGCEYEGRKLRNGQIFDADRCTSCTCLRGQVECRRRECPVLLCQEQYTPPGDCCPRCEGGCEYEMMTFDDGTYFTPMSNPCLNCSCLGGSVNCANLQVCRQNCPHGVRTPGTCCSPCTDCFYEGQSIRNGMTFVAQGDLCNQCRCSYGVVQCVREQCQPVNCVDVEVPPGSCCPVCRGCVDSYGQRHVSGAQFRSPEDRCQLCTCTEGSIVCRREACQVRCDNPVQRPGQCCASCDGCTYQGVEYRNGATVDKQDPCTRCICQNGDIICNTVRCAATPCANPIVPPGECCPVCGECTYDGQTYPSGETFVAPRNPCLRCTCRCTSPGRLPDVCCPVCDICEYERRNYRNGARFRPPGADVCTECSCLNGNVRCSVIECQPVNCANPTTKPDECCPACQACFVNGREYAEGQTFRSPNDPCADCVCTGGRAQCEKRSCNNVVQCTHPVTEAGQCCPVCTDCLFDQRRFTNGQRFQNPSNPCQTCYCESGNVRCDTTYCQPPNCFNPVRKDGQCCPECPEEPCLFENQNYNHVQEFTHPTQPCTLCACNNGEVTCQAQPCPSVPCRQPAIERCCGTCEGCTYQGQQYRNGAEFAHPTDRCRVCSCRNGNVMCIRRPCPPLECPNPVRVPGKCCPECPDMRQPCTYGGDTFEDGERFTNPGDTCQDCVCRRGQVTCNRMPCPSVTCPYPVRGECCQSCNGCFYSSRGYTNGQEFTDPVDKCSNCICQNGYVQCAPVACPPSSCPYPEKNDDQCCPVCRGCEYDNRLYTSGQTFADTRDPCRECTCVETVAALRVKAGNVNCQQRYCPNPGCTHPAQGECCPKCGDCQYQGQQYSNRETFPDPRNPCQQCTCTAGNVVCMPRMCPPPTCTHPEEGLCGCMECNGCKYSGKNYANGATFEDPNNDCNTCSCVNGQVSCNRKQCVKQCDHPEGIDGCCPRCEGCRYEQTNYRNGETFSPVGDPCEECICTEGTVNCGRTICPRAACPNPITQPGQCCPECQECTHSGRRYYDGQTFVNPLDPCEECRCVGTTVMCSRPTQCASCSNPVSIPGQCCPSCQQCSFEGQVYNNGQAFNPDACRECSCANGNVQCISQSCPPLSCPPNQQVQEPGACCKKCLGCFHDGQQYQDGHSWVDPINPCMSCQCRQGITTCAEIRCITPCANTMSVPGQCCPVCSGCMYNNRTYQEGETFNPNGDPCDQCTCEDGNMRCLRYSCENLDSCPPTLIRDPRPGECCPVCLGEGGLLPLMNCTADTVGNNMRLYEDPCYKCMCEEANALVCVREVCPNLNCPLGEQYTSQGECCPGCDRCFIGPTNQIVLDGESYTDPNEPCVACTCNRGVVTCKVEECLPLTCMDGLMNFQPPDRCCEECRGGEVMCMTERCPPTHCESDETPTLSPGMCCPRCMPRPATCTTFGDPHYRTFDGKMIHFQGTCVYTLAADCDGGDFEVLVQNDDRGAFGAVSWTQESKIKLKGVEIELLQKWVVKVNGLEVNLPYLRDPVLFIEKSGSTILVNTEIGLKVLWNGHSYLEVSVPGTYKRKTCGLCGNFNNFPQDDMRLRNGQITNSASVFGNSWKVDTPGSPPCEDSEDLDPCVKAGYRARKEANAKCLVLKSDKFMPCHRVINPEMYFASCVYDLCACGSNDQCLCDALGAYAAECSAAGVILNWRSPSMCAIGCPSERGLMFDECGPICPRTCANKHTVLGDVPTPCFKPCIPSCQCPAGQVLWDNQCVTPGQCPDTGLYNIFR
uniref:Kielin/chordin-like protein n=1 Tax=Branchiostoma floridae TaxID=7739 RepID=C3YUQ0_BRAFL|eukprot:XP_002599939.1 hypothetical protein BRAFLDRAFT_74063 [Branchiostoma floridae]